MREKVPAVLVVLTCTALYHALREWEKNGGAPPQKPLVDTVEAAGGARREEWEYHFNRLNDGGVLYLWLVNSLSWALLTPSRNLYAARKYLEWAPESILGKGIGQRVGISQWHDFT